MLVTNYENACAVSRKKIGDHKNSLAIIKSIWNLQNQGCSGDYDSYFGKDANNVACDVDGLLSSSSLLNLLVDPEACCPLPSLRSQPLNHSFWLVSFTSRCHAPNKHVVGVIVGKAVATGVLAPFGSTWSKSWVQAKRPCWHQC
eukprot:Gb_14450 [translate_table: standard]